MQDKVSRYNIETDYENGVILYNSLTNNVFPISYKDYAVLETLMENLPEFINLYPDLYASMKRSGFIIPDDFDELAYIKLQNKRYVYARNDYHITINPTLDCNLKCWYCSVDYAEAQHNKEWMSDELIEGLMNHIYHLATNQKAHSILLDWFGGEPMMYYDEVVCKVSEFAKKIAAEYNINIRQQITTNATLLTKERIEQMRDSHFRGFQITLDGNEKKHNKVKYYSDKSGTYKDVVNNINLIVDIIPDARITLRINYDKQSLRDIKDIISDISDKSKEIITVSFQKVWQITSDDNLREQLSMAKEEFESAGFQTRFWAYQPFKFMCCYADNYNHYVINYNGKIFKCTARNYGDDMVIGNLQLSGEIIWKDELLSKYYENAAFENEKCENCNILPLCMGPCIQKNYEYRKYNSPMPCIYNNVEYNLSSHIINIAKQKQLIT